MLSVDFFIIIIIILICIVSYRLYITSDFFQLKCIISDVDGTKYCVRERSKLKGAADKLATVNNNMKQLVQYCKTAFPNDERVQRLVTGFNPKQIVEVLPTSEYTAYSENKGEKLAFCLSKEKGNKNNLIDINTLTFVAIHELSHVCTVSIGHTPEFWNNFKFLLIQAKKINIYNPVNYDKEPVRYCSMEITHNPYYA